MVLAPTLSGIAPLALPEATATLLTFAVATPLVRTGVTVIEAVALPTVEV